MDNPKVVHLLKMHFIQKQMQNPHFFIFLIGNLQILLRTIFMVIWQSYLVEKKLQVETELRYTFDFSSLKSIVSMVAITEEKQ